jgi:predicted ATPase/DNA-binding CsgD family transcriptional regulator
MSAREPMARTQRARGSNRAGEIPLEHASFVGRRTQLAAARVALGAARLLTFVGAGGVGKTRFVVRLAHSVHRLYPGGAWYIDLTGVSAEGSVADRAGRVLGLQGDAADGLGAMSQFFGARRGLLVLDNCEQVVDQCAQLIRHLLDNCPKMTVIATSRAALRITAERTFVLEPLDTDEPGHEAASPAVLLFLERCASMLPHPTPDDLEAIAEICRRVDGLPLAIELAAARVQALTPAQIVERLAEPLAFLTGGNRDLPERQQSMRATVAWSYQLCSRTERALWRRMSVFAGGWDLRSAEWMSAGWRADHLTVDLIQSLLEKSIITRRMDGDIVFYEMLNTVRTFGLEMSPEEDLRVAQTLHRDWCLDRLAAIEADWYGTNQAHWLSVTRRELPDIRAALEFCIAEEDGARAATLLVTAWRVVWLAHGRVDQLRRWCARVVELGTSPTPEICQVMTILSGCQLLQGDTETGIRMLERARELADELQDDFSRALVCVLRASIERDPEKAVALYTEALALQQGSNRIPARANVEERLAAAHDLGGNAELAGRMLDALIVRAQRAGESFETASLLCNTAWIAAGRGEVDRATSLLRKSLRLAQQLDYAIGVARVEAVLARVAINSRDYTRAATLLGVAHTVADARGATAFVFPLDALLGNDVVDLARRALGPRSYESAFAKGKQMTTEEGIAYAVGAQAPTRSDRTSIAPGRRILSSRESQVAALVGHGLTDREIADRLVISRRTAEGHVAKSLAKLGFTSRTQLAAWTARESAVDGP